MIAEYAVSHLPIAFSRGNSREVTQEMWNTTTHGVWENQPVSEDVSNAPFNEQKRYVRTVRTPHIFKADLVLLRR